VPVLKQITSHPVRQHPPCPRKLAANVPEPSSRVPIFPNCPITLVKSKALNGPSTSLKIPEKNKIPTISEIYPANRTFFSFRHPLFLILHLDLIIQWIEDRFKGD